MIEKSVKILYILGAGRSGSTLLSNILGQLAGFQNVGELYYLWENGFKQGGVCGCGEPVLACPFWAAVLENAFGPTIEETAVQMQALGRQISRTRHAPLLAIPSSRQYLLDKSVHYVKHLAEVYDAIHDLTGCKVIIDASKFPSYAQVLQTIDSVELYILHLVRDPRAVAFSWQRKKFDPATKDVFGRMGQAKSSAIWLTWNLGGEFLRRNHAKYLQIRYEDVIGSSEQTIRQILDFVGEPVHKLPFIAANQVEMTATHSIAGNPARFKQGAITLKMDHEWVSSMKSRDKALATFLTWPLLHKYHYPVLS